MAAAAGRPSSAYAWYTVSLCMVAYILSFVDRQIIALMIVPIQADLQITDTQFSLLIGFAFALFYAIMGLPLARWADVGPRPFIISAGMTVWSIATAMCGLAQTFWQLFLARIGVGVGEAALSPTAYSIITDSFPKSRLGLALGVYSMGAFLGSGLAFIVGGGVVEWLEVLGGLNLPIIGTVKPWQGAFFIVGLPGVLVALVFYLTVRDPERTGVVDAGDGRSRKGYSIRQVLRYIRGHRATFTAHFLGFGLLSLKLFALLSWAPAYLQRVFYLSQGEAGLYLGVVVLLANTAGVLSSGWLVDFFTRRGHGDAPLRAGIVGSIGVLIPAALFSSMSDLPGALAVLAVAFYFASFPMATSAAGLQLMAPNRMRAQVTALFFVFMNLFGITGGATLVALLTDFVFEDVNAVGYSMSIVCTVAAALGGLILAWGLKYFRATEQMLAAEAAA